MLMNFRALTLVCVFSTLVFSTFVSFQSIAKNLIQPFFDLTYRAQQGQLQAQYQLAMLYKDGKLVRRDYLMAAHWLREAALAGHVKAQYQLALFYNKGRGVVKSPSKVFYWLEQAAMAGFVKAQSKLGELYYSGLGVEKNYSEAVYWYQLAAIQGHQGAMANLAMMYETGQGVRIDYHAALKWYKKADTWWAKKQYAKLKAKVECNESADIRLFWVPLKCASREVLMMAIKDGGAKVKNEDKSNWGDRYFAPSKQFGPSDLFVAYTLENQFALARYTFDNKLGLTTIGDVKDVIVQSYGEPDVYQTLDSEGNQKFSWAFPDGIVLELTQNLADKVIDLSYRDPVNFDLMRKAQQQQKKSPPVHQYTRVSSQL